MIVYWIMFAIPALLSVLLGSSAQLQEEDRRSQLGVIALLVLFAVLVGLRYEVGTDWYNYIRTVNEIRWNGISQAVGYKDPGFGLLTWLSIQAGFDIYGVNIACAVLLMVGLARFVRRQPEPFLAMTVAVPYLIIVVGMGYVRQAAAIGFILMALEQFERRRYAPFFGFMAAAAAFHGGSLLLMALAGLAIVRRRPIYLFPLVVLSAALFMGLLSSRVDDIYSQYVERDYDSDGALIRLLMNAVPAAIFVLYRKRFDFEETAHSLWMIFSIVSFLMLAAVLFIDSTTIVDRVGVYFIPLQLMVFGRARSLFASNIAGNTIITGGVIAYYGLVMFVWLEFASNARNWIPYHFLLLSNVS